MHCALPFIAQIDAPRHMQRLVGGAVHAAEVDFPVLCDLFRNVHRLSQWQGAGATSIADRLAMPKRGGAAAAVQSRLYYRYCAQIATARQPLANIWHWLVLVEPLYRWLRTLFGGRSFLARWPCRRGAPRPRFRCSTLARRLHRV